MKVTSLKELGRIFAQLDGMRDLLARTLEGWQTPQLVVIGNEKTGKSTLLERLCMMPLFPHAEEICTRMRIQVRLRRTERPAPVKLEVINLKTGSQQKGSLHTIPMDGADAAIRTVMEEIVRSQNEEVTGVNLDQMLVLHVQSPDVPSLDLVDTPGLVSTAAKGEPEDMPEQTRSLVQTHIDENQDHSLYLCVVPGTAPPNLSLALKMVKDNRLEEQTICAVTKCDDLKPEHFGQLRSRVSQASFLSISITVCNALHFSFFATGKRGYCGPQALWLCCYNESTMRR